MEINCNELYNPGSIALSGKDLCSYMGFSILLIRDLVDSIIDPEIRYRMAKLIVGFFVRYLAGKPSVFTSTEGFSPLFIALSDLLEEIDKINVIRQDGLVVKEIKDLINYLSWI